MRASDVDASPRSRRSSRQRPPTGTRARSSSTWPSRTRTPRPGCTAGNKPFTDWGQVFADDILAGAILDRLLHHCDVVAINGPSYRLKNRFLTPPNGGTMT